MIFLSIFKEKYWSSMHWERVKKYYIIYFILLVAISLLLASFYKYCGLSLTFGFALGAALSHLIYEVKSKLLTKVLMSGLSKKNGTIRAFLLNIATYIIVALVVIGIILINIYSKDFYSKPILNKAFYPINIIAFVVGVSLTPFLLWILMIKNTNKKGGLSGEI